VILLKSQIKKKEFVFCLSSCMLGGTAVAQCATNRKVAGSIPAGVIGIFH